ncbi:uncharacterized protein [Coffea arabica]|uniref:Uncharacterized protein n=1 Tax=Coffea arabica TaxID=13443 RepID=A0ABM4WNW4_COFAR
MSFLGKTISSLVNDPLFSTIITLCILIFLYFPTLFLSIIFSPVLISTSILLLSLLRLGAIQRTITSQEETLKENDPISAEFSVTHDDDHHVDRGWVSSKSKESSENGLGSDFCNMPTSFRTDSFVEWDVGAPLEVIYEEYEGQEDDEDDVLEGKRDAQMAVIERYASLSKFYPETDDSDSSSDEDFPAIRDWDPQENMCFRWEGEDRDGLIEIKLEGKGYSDGEEENLIEIDLSPAM